MRNDLIVLGRLIGTTSDWTVNEVTHFEASEFEPAPDIDLPTGNLTIDYTKGTFAYYTTDGEVSQIFDIITTIKHLPTHISI